MRRRPRLLRRRLLPATLSVLAGVAIGVVVAGLPDAEALNPIAGRPPLTVKPGALIDPSELTVPPMVLSPSSVPGAGSTTGQASITTATTTTLVDELLPRNELIVMVANGNRTPGSASEWAAELEALGYAPPQVSNTGETSGWVVYFSAGFEKEARRLAQELTPTPLLTAPLSDAPDTDPGFEGQLLVVIGTATV